MTPEPAVELSDAEQVARDLAEVLAHKEQPLSKWVAVPPAGAAELIAGHEVLPHVQRFADAVRAATKVKSIGTYPGHSPSIDRALDLFHAVSDNPLADAISDFAIKNQARYGVRYVIDRQEIWHRLDPVWRWMEDRGDDTQNHRDHNHISFESSAPEPPPKPKPEPEPQGDVHMLTFRYIFEGLDWVFDGPSRLFFHADDTDQITQVLDKIGVPALGKVSAATHRRYSEIAETAGFTG